MNEKEISPLELAQWHIDHLFSLVDVLTKEVEKLNQEIKAMKLRELTTEEIKAMKLRELTTEEIKAIKLRELTTEEIDEHFNQFWYQDDSGVHFDHYGFARAILKKYRR